MHEYVFQCGCGNKDTLRRGEVKRAHFAYKAHRRNGCTGAKGCLETEIHYNAKWLLYDIFPKINFWSVCWRGHRIRKDRYTGPEWTADVEKRIPRTLRRTADVLLTNSFTQEAVALEVHNKNAVTTEKKKECDIAGVHIIEIDVSDINPDCLDLDNEQNQYDCEDCDECLREEKQRRERAEAHRAWWEQNERNRIEHEAIEQEKKRVQNAIIEAGNVDRMNREAVEKNERIEREKAYIDERIAKEATEKNERIKHEADEKRRKADWSLFLRGQRIRAEAARKCGELEDRKRANDKVEQEFLQERRVLSKQAL